MTQAKCEDCGHELSNLNKWKYTLLTTAIFFIVVNPMVYQLTNSVLKGFIGKLSTPNGWCPTQVGLVVHGIVFTLLLRLSMETGV